MLNILPIFVLMLARFVNTRPEFDEWEIGDFPVAGENVIEILVNFFGASFFSD